MIILLILLLTAQSAFATDPVTPNLGLTLYPPNAPWHREAEARFKDVINRNFDLIDAAALGSDLVNVKHYGAVGDGITDDTAAIQSALNVFTNGVTAIASGSLYFPKPASAYKITAPLIYAGNTSSGLHIYGALGGTRGPGGSRIDWHGPAGGTMMILNGANGVTMENLEFNGRSLAKYGIHSSSTNDINTTLGTAVAPGVREVTPASMSLIHVGTLLNIDTGGSLEYVYVTAVTAKTFTATFAKAHLSTAVVGNGQSSSGNVYRRISVGGVTGAGSAALAFGNAESGQTSEVDMYDLQLAGVGGGTSEAGIVTLGANNVKNFKVHGGSIVGFQYGIDWDNASGTFMINGTIMANQTVADVRLGSGNLHMQSVETESPAKFVTGGTGANPGSLTMINCSYQAQSADDYVIVYQGNITLLGNTFYNRRIQGTTLPKIKAGAIFTASEPTTVFSQGNYYENATGYLPIYDGSDNFLFTTHANNLLSVTSLGDYGGIAGALVKLKTFMPTSIPVVATASLPAASATMDGRTLIEDAGAGNRNLIIYGGGERFRIDGGSNF